MSIFHRPGQDVKIGFIGAGRMAKAMIKGLISKKVYTKDRIVVYAPTTTSRDGILEKYGIVIYEKTSDIALLADIIVIACKPKNIAPCSRRKGWSSERTASPSVSRQA